jgi:AcrR family transcriptional regulator
MALPKRHFNEEQAQARRKQVLDAARACFARSGFRGASMAQMSQAAGMSPGHIYNYFASKQDIVASLVAEDSDFRRKLIDGIVAQGGDVLQLLIDYVHLGVDHALRPEMVALNLEIMAEAARNPEIRAILEAQNASLRENFAAVIRSALSKEQLPDAVLAGRIETIHALFEGLNQCFVAFPALHREELLKGMRIALQALLRPER